MAVGTVKGSGEALLYSSTGSQTLSLATVAIVSSFFIFLLFFVLILSGLDIKRFVGGESRSVIGYHCHIDYTVYGA